jgi:hypothetical protein
MDPLAISVAPMSVAADTQAARRQTESRLTLSDMPVEILVDIFLRVRDASVTQAGYVPDGYEFSCAVTDGFVLPRDGEDSRLPKRGWPWMAVTHVCARLRATALAAPKLWNIILLGDGALWASVFVKRSGNVPVRVYAHGRQIVDTYKGDASLAMISHLGAKVSELTVEEHHYAFVQRLVDSLDWRSLELTALSATNLTGFNRNGLRINLPPAFLAEPRPHLTSLNLDHLTIVAGQPCVAFRNVRKIRLHQPRMASGVIRIAGMSPREQTDVLCNLLKEMPLLEEITISHPPQDFSVSFSNAHRTYGRSHPGLRKLCVTGILSTLSALELLDEISLPSEVLFVSLKAPEWDRVQTPLDQDHFTPLLDHLRRFWGQSTATDASFGVPTIAVLPGDCPSPRAFVNVTLDLNRANQPSHLRLHLSSHWPEDLLLALREACQRLCPMYAVSSVFLGSRLWSAIQACGAISTCSTHAAP